MLPLEPGVAGPRGEVPRRHRRIVGAPAVDHADVEPPGEIVHVDPEGRAAGIGAGRGGGGGGGGAGRRGLQQGEEVGSDVDGADDDGVRDEEEEEEEAQAEREREGFAVHLLRDSLVASSSTLSLSSLALRI